MEKEIIELIFKRSIESGGESLDIHLISIEFQRLLDEAYKIKVRSFLGLISNDALKMIDEEIAKDEL